MSEAAILARLHARLICEAAECEAIAARNPDHALRESTEAALRRAEAAALAELLRELPGVSVPDPRQIALFSDGGPRQ